MILQGVEDAYGMPFERGRESYPRALKSPRPVYMHPSCGEYISPCLANRELAHKVTDRAIARAAITKEWVLRELLDNAELAKADGCRAARNRSLELVGKEIGMFGDQEPPKPPRLEDLSSEDLERMLAESVAANPPTDLTRS